MLFNQELDRIAEKAILQDVHRDNVLILERTRAYLVTHRRDYTANLLLHNVINPLQEGEYLEAWVGLNEIMGSAENLPPTLPSVAEALHTLELLREEYNLP